ncbi:MAG: WD40 repeat domain-containing protein [Verrucomicrobiales bacterium]
MSGYAWKSRDASRSRLIAEAEARAAASERTNARRLREHLYAADLTAAQRLMEKGDRGAARHLLEAYLPQPGEGDLRGFDWHWLYGELTGDPHCALPGMGAICQHCVFEADDSLLTASFDGVLRRWNLADADVMTEPTEVARIGAGESLFYSASLPDGSRLLGGLGGLFRIAADGGSPEKIVAHGSLFWVMSPDGRWVAGTQRAERSPSANEIVVSSIDGSQPDRALAGTREWAAFSPDGALLATASEGGHYLLWDVANDFAPVGELELGGNWTLCLGLAFSPDGARLAAAEGESTVLLWDVASRKLRQRINGGTADGAHQPAFSPDGSLLAAAVGQEVWLIDVEMGALSRKLKGHDEQVSATAFSKDGTRLASVGKAGIVRLWDLSDKSATAPTADFGLRSPPVFSADGRFLVGVRPEHPLEVRDTATLDLETIAAFATEHEWPLAFTDGGSTLLTTDRFWELHAWNWREGKQARAAVRLEKPAEGSGSTAALHPNQKLLCGGTRQGLVVIWDTSTGTIANRLEGHVGPVERAVFSADGRWLATAADDRQVFLWNTVTWKGTPLPGHGHVSRGVAFDPAGRWVATACWDGFTRVFALPSGEPLHVLRNGVTSLDGIAVSPDGNSLAVAAADHSVILRDTRTWRQTIVLPPPAAGGSQSTGELHHLAFSPDSRLLIGCADDGRGARFWRLKDE